MSINEQLLQILTDICSALRQEPAVTMEQSTQDILNALKLHIFILLELISQNKSLDYDELEKAVQKAEAEIRSHVRLEQQMKLYTDNLQEKIEQLELEKQQIEVSSKQRKINIFFNLKLFDQANKQLNTGNLMINVSTFVAILGYTLKYCNKQIEALLITLAYDQNYFELVIKYNVLFIKILIYYSQIFPQQSIFHVLELRMRNGVYLFLRKLVQNLTQFIIFIYDYLILLRNYERNSFQIDIFVKIITADLQTKLKKLIQKIKKGSDSLLEICQIMANFKANSRNSHQFSILVATNLILIYLLMK